MITLIPAYGRDYKTKEAFLKDFNDNKDFRALTFNEAGYSNKEDLHRIGEKQVKIRYNKEQKVDIIEF